MQVKEAITSRRHIKQFKPDEVTEEQLLNWLDTARFAPNHKMAEPWEVLVIGSETRATLHHGANFGDAPVVLAFLYKRSENEVDTFENLVAATCFVQNFCLAAWADGVGTRWTSIASKAGTKEILALSDDYEVLTILGVGYPAEVPPVKERTPMASKIKHLS
ncbi:nitroreductase family protein [Alicyclobacillus curvatus]|jgi:nitroreductase|nr:nitroreductase family protein [Alicyclobacillus curvatus]